MIATLFLAFIVLLILGVPIVFSLGLASLSALLYLGHVSLTLIPQRMFVALDSFALMAIPLYVLAGEIMSRGGLTTRIIQFADALVGHLRGGLAQINIVSNLIFAGISGSATADAAALGSVLIPAMVKEGYGRAFSMAITAAAGCLGPIIPPSILMIIFASMTGVSVAELFLAGVLPGFIVAAVFMILTYFLALKRGYVRRERQSLRQIGSSLVRALPGLAMPAIILGGILSGAFTATEAGTVAVVYALAFGIISKDLRFSELKRIFVSAAITSSIVMILIAVAALFAWLITYVRLPYEIAALMLLVTHNAYVMLALIIIFLLIVGLFIETAAALTILTPVLFPIAQLLKIDPVHFGMLVVFVLLIGALTPPVGSVLFVTCSIAKVNITTATKAIWPFVLTMILVAFLIAYVPEISLAIPKLIRG